MDPPEGNGLEQKKKNAVVLDRLLEAQSLVHNPIKFVDEILQMTKNHTRSLPLWSRLAYEMTYPSQGSIRPLRPDRKSVV